MNKFLEIDRYFQLVKEKPQLFTQSDILDIVLDYDILVQYSIENQIKIGVLYESSYNTLVVDLIKKEDNTYYTYERIIPSSNSNGVVCIAKYKDKFIILKQFRHALREYQLSFPRGFGENGLDSFQNALKELYEEIEANTINMQYLGIVVPDSGLSSIKAEVMLHEIDYYNSQIKEEGICEIKLMSYEELSKAIKDNIITDGYTIAAFMLYTEKIIKK